MIPTPKFDPGSPVHARNMAGECVIRNTSVLSRVFLPKGSRHVAVLPTGRSSPAIMKVGMWHYSVDGDDLFFPENLLDPADDGEAARPVEREREVEPA